jgi:hypothetical protein
MKQILKQIARQCAKGDPSTDDEMWRPPLSVLQTAWPELVGREVAAVSRPSGIDWQQGVLTIDVGSEPWCTELKHHAGRLLGRLREVLPWELNRLHFQVADHRDDLSPEASDRQSADRPDSTDQPADEPTSSDDDRAGRTETPSDHKEPEPDEDDALEGLPSGTADAARGILQHIRDDEADDST